MTSADVTSLTTAFDPSTLLATFLLLAPFIIGVVSLLVGISLVKWGIKRASRKLSGGVA
jgi:xanthine/uracil permease